MFKRLLLVTSMVVAGFSIQGFACEHSGKCDFKKGKKTSSEAKATPKREIKRNANSTDVTLAVSGMTCNGCGIKIEEALNKVEGVQGAAADLDKDNVVVTFDKTKVKIEKILKAIDESGYKANLPKEGEV